MNIFFGSYHPSINLFVTQTMMITIVYIRWMLWQRKYWGVLTISPFPRSNKMPKLQRSSFSRRASSTPPSKMGKLFQILIHCSTRQSIKILGLRVILCLSEMRDLKIPWLFYIYRLICWSHWKNMATKFLYIS